MSEAYRQTATPREIRPFVLVGCARSGTTSLARILDGASNGHCAIEPVPNLNLESRQAIEGRLGDVDRLLSDTVLARLASSSEHQVYGEKNVTYGPFLDRIQALSKCRVVFMHRDGRDVVRSLINWHDRKFGTVYRECREPGTLAPSAISSAASLPVALDTSDFSRPRPARESPLGRRWEDLSRLEMCTYYWSVANHQYVCALEAIDRDSQTWVDYTRPDADAVLDVAAFLGLEGLDRQGVADMLARRINSLADRGESEAGGFPRWTDWNGRQRERFEALGRDTMRSLGYWDDEAARWRPRGYGEVWSKKAADLAWYEWMFDGRRRMHEDMLSWLQALEAKGEKIVSAMDFGCGLGVGYSEHLADKHYIGLDISEQNIEWCHQYRDNRRHTYYRLDMIADRPPETADLVFSSGTIDNTYDIDGFIEAMVSAANKWVYFTCYRGWFDRLESHTYRYNTDHACFYNDISVACVLQKLAALGCRDVEAMPLRTGNRDISFEARFIARVPARLPC